MKQRFMVKMELDLNEVLVNAVRVQPIERERRLLLFQQQQKIDRIC
jgi:hypothetical protein